MVDKIPYIDFGGEGPNLHFAHSNGFPPASFRQMLLSLTENFHVTAMFFRPLWPGSRPEAFTSWELLNEDLIQFMAQQDFEQIIGVGHSLGAVTTMKTAVKNPALFRALVLIEPVFLPPEFLKILAKNQELAKQNPLYPKTLVRRNTWPNRQDAFEHFREKPVFRRLSDDALWDYINDGFQDTEDGQVTLTYRREWEAQIYATLTSSVWQEIPQLTQPTLAIRGSDSDTLMPQAWQFWQELQPQAQFAEIPDAGHLVPMERPAAVAAQIFDFLSALA